MSGAAQPDREWWNAQELADAGLPDVPTTQRGVDALSKRLDWRAHPLFARRRAGRGGGWEYHWKLLPVRAQAALLKVVAQPVEASAPRDRGEVWAWFDGLPDAVKVKAKARLDVVRLVDDLSAPLGRHLAVVSAARERGIGERTIWNWLSMVEGVDPADRLAYLAPRHRAAEAKRERAECAPEFLDWLKADYLRVEKPSFKSCYDRVVELCTARGLAVLAERTARRWIDANVPRVTLVLAREGERGLAKCFPPQIRDRSSLTALEAVNADCHKIDVFVQWPGIDTPVRPQIAAFQDLYSNKMLTYRVDLDPNKVAVMQAWGELVETYGIPRHCLFDNGMEFANKWLTGGTPTRFRFKVREDDGLPARTIGEMVDQAAEELSKSGRPLLIDEADMLAKNSFIGIVRDLYESSQGTIILIGEEQMPQTLRRWERVHNRMLDWVQAQPADLREVGLLAALKCPCLTVAPEVQQLVLEKSHARARRIVVNLRQISEYALKTGRKDITAEDAGKITFFTGDAPAPRRIV